MSTDQETTSGAAFGIILCGGASTRMGQSKAMLSFGPEAMLTRVARIVDDALGHVIVVAAADQELPPLPARCKVVRDRRPGLGPLEGLAAGLAAVTSEATASPSAPVFAVSCDAPLLQPTLIHRMLALAEGYDAAAAEIADRLHPLAAVYRLSVRSVVEGLLASGRSRLTDLVESVRCRRVRADELRDADPSLASLRNVNTPEEYAAALAAAGL